MLELQVLRWKNVLSYGNSFTEYKFSKGITRVAGNNGHGKSVFVDALNYAFFGKPFRNITLPTFVNVINKKDLVVELEFAVGGSYYKIQRGIKPNIFKIWKDEELLNQDSHKRDYQRYLEDEVYKFNSNIFEQVSIKSLTKYASFLTLPKNKKRYIMDELFEITVISEMFELNKIHKNKLESESYILQREKRHCEDLIRQELDNLERLKAIKKKLDEEQDEEKLKILEEIKQLEISLQSFQKGKEMIDKYLIEEEKYKTEIKKLQQDKRTLDLKIQSAETKVNVFNQKIKWLHDVCPTCLHVDEIELQPEAKEDEKVVTLLRQDFKKLEEKLNKVKDDLGSCQNITSKLSLINQKIKDNKIHTKKLLLRCQRSSNSVDINEDNYVKLKKELRDIIKKQKSTDIEVKYTAVIYDLLLDEGIKSYIIKKYLPLLNKLMNTYLHKFGLDIVLEFTYNFEVIIKDNFKSDLSYENFSSGEKKRIDASVMFCFLEFCKLKYSTAKVNVLTFDEFTVGLDPEGEGTFYEILKGISEKDHMEIITVSHGALIDPDKIDKIYLASMYRGFSNLTKVEEN